MALPYSLALHEYCRQLILVNQTEAGIGHQQTGQRVALLQQDHARLIEVGVGGVRLSAVPCLKEKTIQVSAIQVVAAVDRHRVVRHIPSEKAAPVERVVERSRSRVPPQIIQRLHRIHAADGTVQSALVEVGVTGNE